MIPADVKANKNKKKYLMWCKIWWLNLTIFFEEVPSKFEIQCKKGSIFSPNNVMVLFT